MSWLMSFLKVISFGLIKEPKKKDEREDYFNDQKGKYWYWSKRVLYIQTPENCPEEIKQAFDQWATVAWESDMTLILAGDTDPADIVIRLNDTVKKGGVTHRSPHPLDKRQIVWSQIDIQKKEKGKRLRSISLHELGHALGLTHDGAREMNVMHPTAEVDKLDSQTENTFTKIYEERNNAIT